MRTLVGVRAGARPGLLAAATVFVLSATIYLATMAPTVTFVDSGELIAAAQSLGVAHPPGFPLYTLLAHTATTIPAGTVAQRVHVVSALSAALAAAMLTMLALEVLRRQGPRRMGAPDVVAAAAGGLLFAFSRTLWSYATVAEVYTLSIAMVLIVALLVLRWSSREKDRSLYVAGALFGLALGVHHVTVVLTVPALLWLVYRARGGRFLVSKTMLATTLVALTAATLVYASLALAASRSAGLNWGDPQTLERLWWHVSGRQYQSFFDFSWSGLGDSLADQARFIARQFGPRWFPLALVVALAGAVRLFLRDRTVFWFLVLLVVPNLGYALVYVISEDKDAYLLPTYGSLALATAVGVRACCSFQGLPRRAASALAIAAALLLAVVSFASSLRFDDRHRLYAAHDYAEEILRSVGPHGFLLTYDWEVYSPLLYELEVQHRRPDVVAVDGNLLRRSWYFDYLARRYPDLMRGAQDPVRLYLEDLRSWEQDRGRYAKGDLNRRIESRFQAVIASLVRVASKSGPVYATQDIALERNTSARLSRRYTFAPHGLAFRLYPDSRFHEPPTVPVRLRGVTDGGVRFERDDVVRQKVLPAIMRMLTLRALYFGYYGREVAARRASAEADRFRRRWGL